MIDNNQNPLSPPPPIPTASDPDTITISRHTLNYVLIAVVFLVIGMVLGAVGYDRLATTSQQASAALIDGAVATVVAALPAGVIPEPTRDPNQRFTLTDEGNPFRGNPDAPITLIEFGDFRCTFCRRFNDETLNPLLAMYADDVRYVYRDYPILGPASLVGAIASECADDQGRFWEFHDWLYANQQNFNREAFVAYATELEMDIEAFGMCLDTNAPEAGIMADLTVGQSLGVGGTPTFFLNGRMITGAQPIQVFQQAIDAELVLLAGDGASTLEGTGG